MLNILVASIDEEKWKYIILFNYKQTLIKSLFRIWKEKKIVTDTSLQKILICIMNNLAAFVLKKKTGMVGIWLLHLNIWKESEEQISDPAELLHLPDSVFNWPIPLPSPTLSCPLSGTSHTIQKR